MNLVFSEARSGELKTVPALLVHIHSAHHSGNGLSTHMLGLTVMQSTTPLSTGLKLKPNFPPMTKASLMNQYFNQNI